MRKDLWQTKAKTGGELTLRVGDETINLQDRNPNNASKIEGDCTNCSTKTDHAVQPILQEISSKDTHEPCSFHNKGSIHEERMLQIEELDEWLTCKPRKHNEPKLCQNELNASPNQLKVGDKVSLDTADPHIDTAKPNEEISLTVLSIFPFGIVEVNHPKFGTFQKELQSSVLLRNLKLHCERFSTTTMSCSTTTIATTRYNILSAQDLWTNEPLTPLKYPPPLSRRLLSKTPLRGQCTLRAMYILSVGGLLYHH
ncbi:hypothetical protein GOBAR_AA28408 [Gossypium barbadense]|uniref:Uncharacterized protein n=1 Tax=Gossypium barbadense TaxID=3634 RepID=A0A2P5WMH0_GOSBA|nr:hypothetical protein GOBAR_AA28408 [Gossypium barbadense]